MLRFLKENGYAIWLGGSVTYFGHLHISDIGWWLIIVPTIILIGISRYKEE